MSQHKFKFKLIKHRSCALDLNPGLQDGWCWQIHLATAVPPIFLFLNVPFPASFLYFCLFNTNSFNAVDCKYHLSLTRFEQQISSVWSNDQPTIARRYLSLVNVFLQHLVNHKKYKGRLFLLTFVRRGIDHNRRRRRHLDRMKHLSLLKNVIPCRGHLKRLCANQCDQIGRFIALWATFQSPWQKLFFPNFQAIFVNVSKSLTFLWNLFWTTFIDIWWLFTGHNGTANATNIYHLVDPRFTELRVDWTKMRVLP